MDPKRAAVLQAGSFGALIAAGLLLASTALRIPFICPLRALTGVPCPFCGMTTGTVATLRGDLSMATAANPFSLLVIPGAVLGLILSVRRALGRIDFDPRRWSQPFKMALSVSAVVLVGASWSFQMFRWGLWT